MLLGGPGDIDPREYEAKFFAPPEVDDGVS